MRTPSKFLAAAIGSCFLFLGSSPALAGCGHAGYDENGVELELCIDDQVQYVRNAGDPDSIRGPVVGSNNYTYRAFEGVEVHSEPPAREPEPQSEPEPREFEDPRSYL